MPARKSAFVHIGVGKTGTTAIQIVLGGLARRGQLKGVSVPNVGGRDQVYLAAAYQPTDRLPRALRTAVGREPAGFAEVLRAEWIAAMRARSSIVVSSEFLSGLSDDEVIAFRGDLTDAGYDHLRCIVYVREPAGLYLSGVQQSLKASALFPHPARFRTEYREILDRWRSLFDPQLIVGHFHPTALVDGDVVIDFLTHFAAFFGIERPEPGQVVRRNESMTAEGMMLMQRYRRHIHSTTEDVFMPDSLRLMDMILAIEPRLRRPATTPRLREDVRRIVCSRAADDVAYLAREFGIEMPIEAGGARVEPDAEFREVTSILQSYDQNALDELYGRILLVLLQSAPPA